MSQAAISDLTHTMDDELNAFSFWIGDSLFAINLDQVLSVEQDSSNIVPDPFEGRGALGIVKHRGVPVRVFDFSEFLGVTSCEQQKHSLIETLVEREQDHVGWLNALEHSLKTGEAFSKARDPHQCAFGKWYDQFNTRDADLMEILSQFDEPHKRIHSLADHLLTLKDRGQLEQALKELEIERVTTLGQLRRLFDRARGQISDSIKSVLLFITTDGKEPRVALRLNEISDMIGFSRSQVTKTGSLGVADNERLAGVFAGYLSTGGDNDCLLVDVEGLLSTIFNP
jgi:purine-binding chemotaxis protein CheW